MAGILFIISAPSGSGKSTLVSQLRSLVSNLEFSISYTTRKPRGSEENGREYHFTTREQFEQMIAAGEFLEYAEVFGNYYGTPRKSLTDALAHGRDLLLDIDVQGAEQVRTRVPDAVSIFVLPPNPQTLASRLRNRSRAEGIIQEEVLELRLKKAKEEIGNYRLYRYILVNDLLDKAVEELTAIVDAERHKRGAPPSPDEACLDGIAESCEQEHAQPRISQVLASFGLDSA